MVWFGAFQPDMAFDDLEFQLEPTSARDIDGPDLIELMARIAQDRDREAFAIVFSLFAPKLKSFLVRQGLPGAEAEEAAQDVMISVWKRAETYDRRQSSVATWIFRIARNRRIDLYRQSLRQTLNADDYILQMEQPELADASLDGEDRDRRVRDALEGLPVEQRDVLRRAFFEGLSQSEISEVTGVALGTVKSRMRLAYEKLRERMGSLH
jgi:RNA polymerase sigma-70 factor (ECF subfamily)